jgi:NAD-reducing hydrogenase large subunit
LSAPDMLLGMDSPAVQRNILGLAEAHPELARDGIRLRQFGQQTIEWLGGKRVHPGWVVPGGVNAPLTEDVRTRILGQMPEALTIAQRTLDWYRGAYSQFSEEIRTFANFPSMFMGLVTPEGWLEHYDGKLRVIDSERNVIADDLDPADYDQHIGETPVPWSYLKMTYYKPTGYTRGCYRVGPLARLNAAERCGTPLADDALDEFRRIERGAVLSSFHYHYARLIEIVFSLERMRELLEDPEILNTRIRAEAGVNKREGIGVSEAPRGTLIHHYRVNDDGLIEWANLIIATGHNNMAMNRGILQAARHFVNGRKITDGALNRIEAVIRCYDPCLSCSTHALGKMPLAVQLLDAAGDVVDEVRRG